METHLLECVVNISEGRQEASLAALDSAAGIVLLDRHTDADHNRSVYTMAGPGPDVEAAVRRLATAVVETLDFAGHEGAHPRIGTLDVVPFVALDRDRSGRLIDGAVTAAVEARDRFAAWAASELLLPCFVYGAPPGPGRNLPEVRRAAWRHAEPDNGAGLRPHPRAGATAVGARPVLVAYNLWLSGSAAAHPASAAAHPAPTTTHPAPTAAHLTDNTPSTHSEQTVSTPAAAARSVAAAIRRPGLRTLGLQVGGAAQVSCNLIDPWHLGPGAVYDLVAAHLPAGITIARAELVGLLPLSILDHEPRARWAQLDIGPDRTIEARLDQAGLDGGSEIVRPVRGEG